MTNIFSLCFYVSIFNFQNFIISRCTVVFSSFFLDEGKREILEKKYKNFCNHSAVFPCYTDPLLNL